LFNFSLASRHKLCINTVLPSLGNLQAVSLAPPYGGAFFAPQQHGRASGLPGLACDQQQVSLDIMAIADPAIGALHERRLVLVRPDGHMAWRSNALPADPSASSTAGAVAFRVVGQINKVRILPYGR
jgi:hypothetical protein